ncbi:MAG TPA: hypothetical protein PKC44_16860, partial [Agitococcus sp.]|nr:hypothetical protein [Agitococcus sp.]
SLFYRIPQIIAICATKPVFGTNGINCDVGEHIGDLRPRLGNDGHVGCPCLTDMGCAMVNPQYTDESGEVDAKVVAKAPKGSTCSNPLPWAEARQNVGRTLVVVGPVVNVTTDATRKPSKATWINVGERFPNVNRLTLVIWNNASFKLQQPKQLEGKLICVVGKISSYRGSAQIVIRSAEEFRVSQ